MNDKLPCKFNAALVIDDSETDILTNRILLRSNNICNMVYTATSVDSALQLLKVLSADILPQAIFLEINLPEKSGFDFIDAFEKFPEEVTAAIKIYILSAYLHCRECAPLQNKYANHPCIFKVIKKPLTLEKLMN